MNGYVECLFECPRGCGTGHLMYVPTDDDRLPDPVPAAVDGVIPISRADAADLARRGRWCCPTSMPPPDNFVSWPQPSRDSYPQGQGRR